LTDDKQKQFASENSFAIQAGCDINVTYNNSLSVSDVRDIVDIVFLGNFPNIQSIAQNEAKQSVEQFAIELEKKLSDRIDLLDISKFAKPDVQNCLKDASISVGLKGETVDIDLITSLIVERVKLGQTDLVNLLCEEAIRISSKITTRHLNYLTLIHYLTKTIHNSATDVAQLEIVASEILSLVNNALDLSDSEQQYLNYLGLVDVNYIATQSPANILWADYSKKIKLSSNSFREDIGLKAPSLEALISSYEAGNYGHVFLTTLGRFLGVLNLKKIWHNVDYRTWIK